MIKFKTVALLVCLCAVLGLVAQTWAAGGINTPDPQLPPVGGPYMSPADVHATYSGPGLMAVLSQIQHQAFSGAVRNPLGLDEIESFNSSMHGQAMVNGLGPIPVEMMGPVQTLVLGKMGNTTGTFDTEMLSMSLTGMTPLGPLMVRESPTLPSLGRTSITDIGGGMYHIDSFFDVFTELSLDGGQSWIPSQGPTRVNLCPEPASLALAGLAAIGTLTRRRRFVQ